MEAKQEIEYLFNYLVSKCLNTFDWKDKSVYIGTGKEPHSILLSEKAEYDTLLEKLIKYDKNLIKTISRKSFSDQLFEYIWKCRRDGYINVSFQCIIDNVIKILNELELEERIVFHTIEGIDILAEVPVSIGNFVFYNADIHRKCMEEEYLKGKRNWEKEGLFWLKQGECWVSTRVITRDYEKAIEEGIEKFELLQNILRFLLSYCNPKFDVGILNYKRYMSDEIIVLSEKTNGICMKNIADGALKKVDINVLLESYSSIGIDSQNLIRNIDNIHGLSKMEQRIMNAIDLYGRANRDYGKAIGFLEAMLSVESLFQRNLSDLASKSIGAEISEMCAFFLGNSFEERVNVEKRIKNLYGIRSKIAHGASMLVEEKECRDVMDCAWNVIIEVIIKSKQINIKTEEDLYAYIQRMRYT